MVLKNCYLLAGMMMTANIFVVNEVMAMEPPKPAGSEAPVETTYNMPENANSKGGSLPNDNIISGNNDTDQKDKKEGNSSKIKENIKPAPILHILIPVFGKILRWENTINFTIGSALSLANNYFKWWDYNKGGYWKLGCLGWRSGRFLKGYFQFDVNLNIGRGFSWLIPGLCNFISMLVIEEDDLGEGIEKTDLLLSYFCSSFLFYNIGGKINNIVKTISDDTLGIIAFGIVFCLQGFLSMPLVIHISTFDFTIALDSLIWVGVGFLSHLRDKKENKKEKEELIKKPENKVLLD